MNKQKDYKQQNKVNNKNSQNHHEEPWVGNPDDQESNRTEDRERRNN